MFQVTAARMWQLVWCVVLQITCQQGAFEGVKREGDQWAQHGEAAVHNVPVTVL